MYRLKNKIKLILTMIRSPFILLLSVLWTILVASTQTILYPILSNYWRRDMVGVIWSHGLALIAGMRVKTSGRENLPKEGAIYLFNHTSNYDIPICYVAVPRFLRFGAKESLFKIPFLSIGMRNMKVIPIDRGNREKVLASYRKIYSEVKEDGESVILAPEGTRQMMEEIGPFKTGPFIFAVECGCSLVPVVISGASEILGKKSLWINLGKMFRRVHVKILPPVSTGGYTLAQIDELKEEVRAMMIEGLREAQRERAAMIDPPLFVR